VSIGVQFDSMPIHNWSRNLSARSCFERQREGVQRAKHKGRAPTARAKSDDILRLAADGVKRDDIAARLGVGRASVYRVLAERKAAMLQVASEGRSKRGFTLWSCWPRSS
jgi:DNA invertase Pin-like site-specific DNA recombinase